MFPRTAQISQLLVRLVHGKSLRAHLVRGAFGSAGVQAANRVLALALGVILARTLGPSSYGVYAYAFAIMSLLMVAAEAGVPALLMREIAAAEGQGEWGLMRGALKRGIQFVALISIFVSVAGLLTLALVADQLSAITFHTLAIMLLLLPLAAQLKTVAHALRGLQLVVRAQTLELLLQPTLVIAFIGFAFFYAPDLRTPWGAMIGQLLAVTIVLGASVIWLKKSIPSACRTALPEYRSREWLKSALPFALIGGALVINNQTDMVMLGWFGASDDVGIYRVAVQGAMLVTFSLQAINAVVAPQLSRLYAQKDMELLQKVVTRSVRVIAISSFTVFAVLAVLGKHIIILVFGYEYLPSHGPLVILAMGQLLTAMFGISGPLLSMTRFEGQLTTAVWVSTLLNIFANIALIPKFGVHGAAVSTACTLAGWSIYLAWVSNSRLGIHISPLSSKWMNTFKRN